MQKTSNTRASKPTRRRVDGVLLIDKPVGPSSQQVVGVVKRLLQAEKVGHGGTLDPLASGLLIVGLGEATKFLQRHLDGDKTYVATLRFGAQTSTGDLEGNVIATTTEFPSETHLQRACAQHVGQITQLPPQFSALKVAGKPAYAYARAGESVELEPRTVRIDSVRVMSFNQASAEIEVRCGKGTYIRTLAEDIARTAGSLAHLSALRRTGSRGLTLADAVTLDDLQTMETGKLDRSLRPIASLLDGTASLPLDAQQVLALSQGRSVAVANLPEGEFAVSHKAAFCGLVYSKSGMLSVLRWTNTNGHDSN